MVQDAKTLDELEDKLRRLKVSVAPAEKKLVIQHWNVAYAIRVGGFN
jgi:hypothetical protein